MSCAPGSPRCSEPRASWEFEGHAEWEGVLTQNTPARCLQETLPGCFKGKSLGKCHFNELETPFEWRRSLMFPLTTRFV